MAGKRMTLSDRERMIVAEVLSYMTRSAKALGSEGECILRICISELHALRKRMLDDAAR